MPVIIIGGPTASGKTGLALALAQACNGEIINADSIQLYEDLPTLTAQPDEDERKSAPHHLYGIYKANIKSDAQSWRDMAEQTCRTIAAQGKTPIIVGGTGFYIKAMIEGFSPIPDIPQDIHDAVISRAQEMGNTAFLDWAIEHDPKLKNAHIDLQNPMRVMRAIEVFEATGESITNWHQKPLSGAPKGFNFFTLSITPDRDWLYDRCNRRFDIMIEQGALNEVKELHQKIEHGISKENAPITRAIGYAELSRYILGTIDLITAKEQACTATRQYAKRQTTWFKNQWQPNAQYIPHKKNAWDDLVDQTKAFFDR